MDDSEKQQADLRAAVDARPEHPHHALGQLLADLVHDSFATGELGNQLREAGWVLVPDETAAPPPPEQWLHDGLDICARGWIDPIGRLAELWETAWKAGHAAARASEQR